MGDSLPGPLWHDADGMDTDRSRWSWGVGGALGGYAQEGEDVMGSPLVLNSSFHFHLKNDVICGCSLGEAVGNVWFK